MPLTPATTDKFTKVGSPGSATTLAAPGYTQGNGSINVGSTSNWQTETLQVFAIDRAQVVNGEEERIAGTYNEFVGIVSSATVIGNLTKRYGNAQDYAAGALTRVYIPVSSTRENDLIDGLAQDHNLKGNHKTLTDDNGNEWLERGQVASAVNHVKIANNTTGNAPSVEGAGDDANVPLNLKSKGTAGVQINGSEIDAANSFQNYVINGGCLIAQRPTAPTLSTTSQYGRVDRFRVHATGTAVSAGSITQSIAPNVTSLGNALHISGATITGTGVIYIRYRMEAADAKRFKNSAASFSVKVYHDVGSAINATIYVRKPTVADNFAAVTDIANSGAQSVPNAAATTIKFENINTGNLGDVSNGIEIEIQIACGAVTTKNFELAEFQFNRGSKALPFHIKPAVFELKACERYYETIGRGVFGMCGGANTAKFIAMFKTRKRGTPACTQLTTTPNIEETWYAARVGSGSALFSYGAGVDGASLNVNGFSSMTLGNNCHSEQSDFWAIDAEL